MHGEDYLNDSSAVYNQILSYYEKQILKQMPVSRNVHIYFNMFDPITKWTIASAIILQLIYFEYYSLDYSYSLYAFWCLLDKK